MDSTLCVGVLGAWRAFLTAHSRLTEAVDHRLVAAGCIALGTFDVLVAVHEAPEHRRRMHEVAEHVVLSRSGLTRLVDRLEADGLLRRERCPNDRRGAYAVLTESGERALETAWPVYAASVRELFGDVLSDAEAVCVREALERASALADPARDA